MTTLHRVRELIARHFDMPADALESSTSIESLGADSYDRLELQQVIIDEFAIDSSDRIMPPEYTIGDIVRVIDTAKAAAA